MKEKLYNVQPIKMTAAAKKSAENRAAQAQELAILAALKRELRASDMNQADLAPALSVQRSQITKILKIDSPDRSHATLLQILIIAGVLGMTLDLVTKDKSMRREEGGYNENGIYTEEELMGGIRGVIETLRKNLEDAGNEKRMMLGLIADLRHEKNRMAGVIDELKKALASLGAGSSGAMGAY